MKNDRIARRRLLLLSLSGLAAGALTRPALAQGFAGLGSGGSGFALPKRGHRLSFPRDHLPHPEFRIEWWYVTANLTDDSGADWGIQWTLFRSALEAGAPEQQAWMGHAAVTSAGLHRSTERLGRSGQAGVAAGAEGPRAWIDEWQMTGDPTQGLTLRAGGTDFAFELTGPARGPLVLQGDAGYSVKSASGSASHYFSQPYLELTGWIDTGSGPRQMRGTGWLDREWSSEPLAEDQKGWDWFSLTFDSGEKLMAFTLRGASPWRTAAWILPGGEITTLPPGSLSAEPLAWARAGGHKVPIRHRLRLDARGMDITVDAVRADCWMPMLFPYWEGPVRVSGSHTGYGYLEMTGYKPD